MEMNTKHDGVLFTGTCNAGQFTRGRIGCPTCGRELREEVASTGDAYLICNTADRGCVKPTKSFSSQKELNAWREQAWQTIADICRNQGPR